MLTAFFLRLQISPTWAREFARGENDWRHYNVFSQDGTEMGLEMAIGGNPGVLGDLPPISKM